jgi:hypothetical protein
MAARKPRTRGEFLDVHGVGQRKLEEYGDSFLAEILRGVLSAAAVHATQSLRQMDLSS